MSKEQNANKTTEAVDLDGLSLDEIKKLAQEEATTAVKQAEEPQEEKKEDIHVDETEDTGEQVFRREIDLGDGSGVQVFEAPTLEELVDKLAKAQVNATKKIRELNSKIKEVQPKRETETPKEREFSSDEEFVISQEMMSKPSKAFKKMFKEMVGLDITEFRTTVERMNAFNEAQTRAQAEADIEAGKARAAESFLAAHPEYVPNQSNGTRLSRAVNLLIKEEQAEGREIDYGTLLLKAYDDLKSSGLLEIKSEESAKETTGTDEPRIEESVRTVPVQRPVKRASTITTRSTTTRVAKAEPTEEELYTMPLDKLRELANSAGKA